MSPEELAAIRERADKATQGPWGVYESAHGAGVECGSADMDDVGQLFVESYGLTYTPNPADAAFIAHAREDVPALLDHAAELQARLDKVRALHQAGTLLTHWGKHRTLPDDTLVCTECTDPDASGAAFYPCLTIQAIDGSDQ